MGRWLDWCSRVGLYIVIAIDVLVLLSYLNVTNFGSSNYDQLFDPRAVSQDDDFEGAADSSSKSSVELLVETDEQNGDWIVPPATSVSLDTSLILYNRVPKCGSTTMLTLIKALKKFHKMKNIHPFYYTNDIKPNQKHYMPTLEERLNFTKKLTTGIPKPHIYIRHLHFINFTHYNAPMPMYINVIRDPVEHFISNYYYLRNGFERTQKLASQSQKEKWKHQVIKDNQRNVTLTQCIDEKHPGCVNVYSDIIPYFCGNDPWCRKRERRAVDQAKHNILHSFIAVGVLEEIEETLELFELILPQFFKGMRWLYRKHTDALLDRSKTFNKRSEDERVKSYLRERLQPEMEVYQYAKEIMDFRLRNLRQDLGVKGRHKEMKRKRRAKD